MYFTIVSEDSWGQMNIINLSLSPPPTPPAPSHVSLKSALWLLCQGLQNPILRVWDLLWDAVLLHSLTCLLNSRPQPSPSWGPSACCQAEQRTPRALNSSSSTAATRFLGTSHGPEAENLVKKKILKYFPFDIYGFLVPSGNSVGT